MNRKRRNRKHRAAYRGRKMQVNFLPVIVIICLSVVAGYFTAKYVISPLTGYEPAELSFSGGQEKETLSTDLKKEKTPAKETAAQKEPKILEDGAEVKDEAEAETEKADGEAKAAKPSSKKDRKVSGYALQFGSYTTKSAAEKSLKQLEESGIAAGIKEKDGYYKVIGKLFDTKEAAKKHLDELDTDAAAFVTELSE